MQIACFFCLLFFCCYGFMSFFAGFWRALKISCVDAFVCIADRGDTEMAVRAASEYAREGLKCRIVADMPPCGDFCVDYCTKEQFADILNGNTQGSEDATFN